MAKNEMENGKNLAAILRDKYEDDFESDMELGVMKSGFPSIDYGLAYVVDVYKKNEWQCREIQKGILNGSYMLIVGKTSSGKMAPYSTQIPVPNGVVRMGELKVGDVVFSEDGSQTVVTGIYEQGIRDTYKVVFRDGRMSRCGLEHLWSVITKNGKRKTLSLSEIMKDFTDGKTFKYRVPRNDWVEYNPHPVQSDPWAYGVLYTKGVYINGNLCIETSNPAIAKGIAIMNLWDVKNTFDNVYSFSRDGEPITRQNYFDIEEEIPDCFKYNSIDIRLNLLKGMSTRDDNVLMPDMIASLDHMRIDSMNSESIHQIKHIVWSLGLKPFVTTELIDNNRLIFHLSIMKGDLKDTEIVEIIPDVKEECRCIMVDHPKHTYLTDEYVVTHNTTLATQIAANIIRPYKEGMVQYFDLERGCELSHVMKLSQLPFSDFDKRNPEHRYNIVQSPTSHEDIQRVILRIYKEKMMNKERYQIKLDQHNAFGDEIITMQPTVIVIDSIPMIGNDLQLGVAKDERKMEEALTQMDAAQTAGAFKRMMKMILGPMKQANIIVIGISHIGTKISSNPMIPNKKDFRAMGQDEIIAGGTMNTYGATNIIKTDRRGGKGYTVEDGDGFNGFDSAITIVKSRTTFDAKVIPMIYDCENGFDSIRSLIQYGIERGIITGNRARMKFTEDPDCSFSYVKLYEEIKSKPILDNIKKFIIPSFEEPYKVEKEPEQMMNLFLDY